PENGLTSWAGWVIVPVPCPPASPSAAPADNNATTAAKLAARTTRLSIRSPPFRKRASSAIRGRNSSHSPRRLPPPRKTGSILKRVLRASCVSSTVRIDLEGQLNQGGFVA